MLTVISPAKRLDWSGPATSSLQLTDPDYQADATRLARIARKLSLADLRGLMDISEDLAALNQTRFKTFAAAPAPDITRPAALAFAGDTYIGLEAKSLEPDALRWAQDHLRILSGLYGLLRPLDRIQPYRLEMGSRLATSKGVNLYEYWGKRLSKALNLAGAERGTDLLLNCASIEYFSAVDRAALKLRVITPVFLEDHPTGPRIISFHAKKARGAMARFVIEHRLTDLDSLKEFTIGGYRYAPDLSEGDRLVFLRGKIETSDQTAAA